MKVATVSLKEACTKITDGTHHSPPIVTEGVPYVTAKHIKPDGVRFHDNPWFVSEESHAEIYSRCDPKIGDVLYIKDGATTGIAAVNEYDFPFSMLSSVALLRPNPELCLPEYLCRWLNSPNAKDRFLGRMGGAAIKRLTLAKIKEFEIPLPPLAEQKRIAGILDAADALRAKRRESLAQLDTLLQSTFLDLFGDPVTNPMGWEQKPLGSICDVGSSKRVFLKDFVDEGVPFYRGTEIGQLGSGHSVEPDLFITTEHYEIVKSQSGVPRIGDLLLPSICPDGRIFLVKDDTPFYFKDGRVLWIKSGDSPVDSAFLRYHLKHLFFANYSRIASGTTFAELKIFALKDLLVHYPPLPLQRRFAAIVASVEQQKARMRAHLADLDALFASLQSRAFNGEL